MFELREAVIELTKRCNLNCIHCGSDCKQQARDDELSIMDWKKVLQNFKGMNVEKVVFSGGEPTLKPGFAELIAYSSGLGFKTGFISNGYQRFSSKLKKQLCAKRIFAVGLSIDGLKDTHNQIRRNDQSFAGLMQNINILQNCGVEVCAVTTLHKLNWFELPRLARFISMAGIDSWQLQLAMPAGRMKEQQKLLINKCDFQIIVREIIQFRLMYPDLNIQAADCFGIAPENSIRKIFWTGCTAGISSLGIDACGNVMPCLSLQESARTENVKEYSVAKIWNNSAMFDFNRKFDCQNAVGACAQCKYLADCRGGCGSQSFAYHKHYHDAPFCVYRDC